MLSDDMPAVPSLPNVKADPYSGLPYVASSADGALACSMRLKGSGVDSFSNYAATREICPLLPGGVRA